MYTPALCRFRVIKYLPRRVHVKLHTRDASPMVHIPILEVYHVHTTYVIYSLYMGYTPYTLCTYAYIRTYTHIYTYMYTIPVYTLYTMVYPNIRIHVHMAMYHIPVHTPKYVRWHFMTTYRGVTYKNDPHCTSMVHVCVHYLVAPFYVYTAVNG